MNLGILKNIFSNYKYLFYSVFLFVGLLYALYNIQSKADANISSNNIKTIIIGNAKIKAYTATSDSEKQQGLSGRKSLGQNEGMLFDYNQNPETVLFWMKDMLIPIDIIWVKDGKISKIDSNLPIPKPATSDYDLLQYSSKGSINYVLEVNAGFSELHNIKAGDRVEIR